MKAGEKAPEHASKLDSRCLIANSKNIKSWTFRKCPLQFTLQDANLEISDRDIRTLRLSVYSLESHPMSSMGSVT